MKFFKFITLVFFLLPLGFADTASATSNAPKSIGFHLCLAGDCAQSKINFSECGQNAKNDKDGKCVCLDGFIGDGKNCLKTACPNGTYSVINQGAEDCITCPAGYFCQHGVKQQCSENFVSLEGADACEKCPDGTYSFKGASVCCLDAEVYDPNKKECISCPKGQGCHCPQNRPYSNGQGECVECLTDEQCASGFCSNQSCCPAHSSTLIQKGTPLQNGCFCQPGYEPNAEQESCVATYCSQVENSSTTGVGDATSLEGCFCNITHPHWQNGRCMRAKDCTVLMEYYGLKKGLDFQDDFTAEDQKFLNTIYVPHAFKTPSDMDLTGCNLIVKGDFQNDYKLTVDSLLINFDNFTYNENALAQNTGTIVTKGLTASRFINNGTIIAPQATVNVGYLENRGNLYADSIYELNNSPSIVKNLGTMTITNDFLFGSMSNDGYVQNSGKIIVGGDWDSNNVYNWNNISIHGNMNQEDVQIHNEGTITIGNHEMK